MDCHPVCGDRYIQVGAEVLDEKHGGGLRSGECGPVQEGPLGQQDLARNRDENGGVNLGGQL